MPLAPLVIVNHAAFEVAVHEQPAAAVTFTVPVVEASVGLTLVGLIEYEQPVPAVMVKLAFDTSK